MNEEPSGALKASKMNDETLQAIFNNLNISLECKVKFEKDHPIVLDPIPSVGNSLWALPFTHINSAKVLKPKERAIYTHPITIDIPEGWYGRIEPNNELTEQSIDVFPYILDAGKQQIKIVIQNNSLKPFIFLHKMIIAYVSLIPIGTQKAAISLKK